MITLSNTIIRLYKKGNGNKSYRLRSHFLIETETSFSLSTYLRDIKGYIELSSGELIELEEIAFSYEPFCRYNGKTLAYDFQAFAISDLGEFKDSLGNIRLDFTISFTGHDILEPNFLETRAPIVYVRQTTQNRKGLGALNPQK